MEHHNNVAKIMSQPNCVLHVDVHSAFPHATKPYFINPWRSCALPFAQQQLEHLAANIAEVNQGSSANYLMKMAMQRHIPTILIECTGRDDTLFLRNVCELIQKVLHMMRPLTLPIAV